MQNYFNLIFVVSSITTGCSISPYNICYPNSLGQYDTFNHFQSSISSLVVFMQAYIKLIPKQMLKEKVLKDCSQVEVLIFTPWINQLHKYFFRIRTLNGQSTRLPQKSSMGALTSATGATKILIKIILEVLKD